MADEKKLTILCVDDEKDIVDSLYDIFMNEYNVKTALNGKDALRIFEKEDIFLVISDQRMPDMTGSEFLAEINKKSTICKKILLTGYADINAAIDAINKGGVDNYFSKPWDDDELLSTAKKLQSLYKMDSFFERILADGKELKEQANESYLAMQNIEVFFDNYPVGLCIVDDKSQIVHFNKKAQEVILCTDQQKYIGSNYKEIFLLNDEDIEMFEKDFSKEKLSFKTIQAKIGDGSHIKLDLGLVFNQKSNWLQLNGIVFNHPKKKN
ncbi:MAG: response regulator [Desulfobacterales bacterium]|nr:response regulator [Desulfobacterales bacterium]